MMREVQRALDKAVKGKTLKKNTASRKKSRLSKLVKKLS
jgi:ribosomal protein S20